MVATTDLIHVASTFEVAFTTLFVGLIIGKLLGKVVARAFDEAELNQVAPGMSVILGRIVQYVTYGVTVIVLLQFFDITRIVIEVALAVVLVVAVVAFLMVIRDAVPNTLAGLIMRARLKQLVGKKVKIGTVSGILEKVGFLACLVKSKDTFYVPHVYTWKKFKFS